MTDQSKDVVRIIAGAHHAYIFYCLGCKHHHHFNTVKVGEAPCWSFNGDLIKPTFGPSLLCNASIPKSRCHLYVKEGQIQYLDDCHHDLAGQTVDMTPIDEV